jgi:hypothetical protein
MDKKTIAADLRLEADKLQEEAKQLLQAAEILDPSPRQATFVDASFTITAGPEVVSFDNGRKETILDLAVEVLRKVGRALPREDLLEHVKARGGRVATLESFSSALSRAKDKVVPLGNGQWDLAERQSDQPIAEGMAPAITAEAVREYLKTRSARIPDLRRLFKTSERAIRKIVNDPANGIEIHGPGWLRVRETLNAGKEALPNSLPGIN